MAQRRMFSKTIIDSDVFLDMPHSTQLLYFHLSMRADDDGFINNPKNIMRMIACKDDDLKILLAKQFIFPFESGVVVIKHWLIHNYIQKDRYTETKYKKEKSMLKIDGNREYQLIENDLGQMAQIGSKKVGQIENDPPKSGTIEPKTECIQNVYRMDTQVRDRLELDKNSIYIYGQNKFDLDHLPKNDPGQNGSKDGEGGQDYNNDIINDTPPNMEVWEEQFGKFYKEYPRKVKKQNVKKWFKKNKPSSELFSSMMSSLEQFRGSKDWLADNGQYIPYPSTWLNQKRWEDEDINNAKTIPKARTKEERHIHQMKVLEGL